MFPYSVSSSSYFDVGAARKRKSQVVTEVSTTETDQITKTTAN